VKLDGGIDEYRIGKRYKTETAPYGRKVRYLNTNGYDSYREYANQYIKEGEIYTVREIWVGGSSSDVELVEIEDRRFNTVMFEDVEEII
jgi:hypothetical protein